MKHWLAHADLYAAAGHTHVPIPIEEIRQMATRVKGSVTKDGKFKPKDTTPKPLRKSKAMKAARVEKGLRQNRASKRGA